MFRIFEVIVYNYSYITDQCENVKTNLLTVTVTVTTSVHVLKKGGWITSFISNSFV